MPNRDLTYAGSAFAVAPPTPAPRTIDTPVSGPQAPYVDAFMRQPAPAPKPPYQDAIMRTQPATPPTATDVQAKLRSLVQHGSMTPPAPTTPAVDLSKFTKPATLINPTTGEKVVVESGSPDAQTYFGQGFALMGPDGKAVGTASGANTSGSTTSTTTPTTSTGLDLGAMRERANQARNDMFSTVYGYTPDEWQNLSPAAQRRLRNQRVQDLAKELGNVNDAIKTAKEDEKNQRETAVDTLNTYLKYGVLDQLSAEEQASLAASTGLSPKALAVIGAQEDPPELRSVDGDLYAVQWNKDTKTFETTLVKAGKPSGGGGGNSDFEKEAASLRSDLVSGDIAWGQAFDSLKIGYPEKSNAEIDRALRGSAGMDAEGNFTGKNSGLAVPPSTKSGVTLNPDGSIKVG